jgi:hypothetical protein
MSSPILSLCAQKWWLALRQHFNNCVMGNWAKWILGYQPSIKALA